jgi:cyclase
LSAAVLNDPNLIRQIADEIGQQSVVVVLDVKKRMFSKEYDVFTHNGKKNTKRDAVDVAKQSQALGAGEIVINSIDHDGEMKGYDLLLAQKIRQAINIPITILGGAGSLNDIGALIKTCGVVGASAGSLFVFKGVYKAVLINYPSVVQRDELFRVSLA